MKLDIKHSYLDFKKKYLHFLLIMYIFTANSFANLHVYVSTINMITLINFCEILISFSS